MNNLLYIRKGLLQKKNPGVNCFAVLTCGSVLYYFVTVVCQDPYWTKMNNSELALPHFRKKMGNR